MATRATYQINKTTYYCHWDGYPIGAATRFANMVAAGIVPSDEARPLDAIEDRRGGWEFAFIRGVMDAEPTQNRDYHGDTEYHYILDQDKYGAVTIIVQEPSADRVPGGDRGWRSVERLDLADWLNKQRADAVRMYRRMKDSGQGHYKDIDPERDALEAIPVIVKVFVPFEYGDGGHTYYATKDSAKKIALRYAAIAAGFQPDNANKANYQKKADAWMAAVKSEAADAG